MRAEVNHTYVRTYVRTRTLARTYVRTYVHVRVHEYNTWTIASSPGHSQFLMIHAKNEKAWFAKSRAPHLGGTWKGDYRAWAGDLFACSACSTVPIVPGTGIATGRRVAIAALQ